MDGCGVLGVSEELAAPPAGDVAPSLGNAGVYRLDAPSLPGRAHGRAVPPGQERQPPVGKGQAAALHDDPQDQSGLGQGGHDLVEAGKRDVQQAAHMFRRDSRPVVEQVEKALLGGLQQGRQQPVWGLSHRTLHVDVLREGSPHRLRLRGEDTPGRHVGGQDVAKVQGGGDGGQPPDGFRGACPCRVPFQGEDGRHMRAGERPAGVPQPHLVGHEHEDGSGKRSLSQPPEPLRKPRPVRREPLPDDAESSSITECHRGVEGRGPVPAQSYGAALCGDGRGQPVDDGHPIQSLQEDATPLGRDGTAAEQLVRSDALYCAQPSQSCAGEMKSPCGPEQVGGVWDG